MDKKSKTYKVNSKSAYYVVKYYLKDNEGRNGKEVCVTFNTAKEAVAHAQALRDVEYFVWVEKIALVGF